MTDVAKERSSPTGRGDCPQLLQGGDVRLLFCLRWEEALELSLNCAHSRAVPINIIPVGIRNVQLDEAVSIDATVSKPPCNVRIQCYDHVKRGHVQAIDPASRVTADIQPFLPHHGDRMPGRRRTVHRGHTTAFHSG